MSRRFPWTALLLVLLGCSASERTDPPPAPDLGHAPPDLGPDLQPDLQPDLGELLCQPGEVRCEAMQLAVCDRTGQLWQLRDCPAQTACRDGQCLPQVCEPGAFRCANETNRLQCEGDGVAWRAFPCAAGEVCLAGQCQAPPCDPGEAHCRSARIVEACNLTGTAWTEVECPAGTLCSEGTCRRPECEAGARRCSPDLLALEACIEMGARWATTPCGAGEVCVQDDREVRCELRSCAPGETRCSAQDLRVRETCLAPGLEWAAQLCEGDWLCFQGECRPLVCPPGASWCEGANTMSICNDEGTGWSTVACPGRTVCDETGRCRELLCLPGQQECLDATTTVVCNEAGTARSQIICQPGMRCALGRCRPVICEPGARRCLNLDAVEACRPEGTAWEPAAPAFCPPRNRCERGDCAPEICTAGTRECLSAHQLRACSPGGTYWTEAVCGVDRICEEAACQPTICEHGSTVCLDLNTQGRCRASGTGYDPERACLAELLESCRLGHCMSRCEERTRQGSTAGCEFRVIVPGPLELANGEAVLLLTNPEEGVARVRLQLGQTIEDLELNPGGSATVPLRTSIADETSQLLPAGALRLLSDVPITASLLHHQPAQVGPPATPGRRVATTLLPVATWGRDYLTPELPAPLGRTLVTTLTILAARPQTRVTIRPGISLVAGPRVPAIPAGAAHEFLLQDGDVLLLRSSAAEAGASPTVQHIDADQPIGLLVGTRGRPDEEGRSCQNQALEQLPPRTALGNRFVLARPWPAAPGIYRITAAADPVRLTAHPPRAEVPAQLAADQILDLALPDPTILEADGPLLVLDYLAETLLEEGRNACPELAYVAPEAQWTQRIGIAIPPDGGRWELLLFTRTGNPVELDRRLLEVGWIAVGQNLSIRRSGTLGPGLHVLAGLVDPVAATLVSVAPDQSVTSYHGVAGAVRHLGLLAE